MRIILTVTMVGMLGASGLPAFAASSLDESFQAAVKRSETVAISRETVNQAEERYRQLVGSLLPNINGVATYTRLPAPSGSSNDFNKPDRPEVKITARQALFHGFSEYAALKQSKLEREAFEEARRQASVRLYSDVATNFYTVLSLEHDLKELRTQIDLNNKRVRELNERKRIGRSRLSEVLTVQSALATLQAQAAGTAGQLSVARDAFVFLTGFEHDRELRDAEPLTSLSPLLTYLGRIENRPDVRGSARQAEAGDAGISVARGGHLPAIDLAANYYIKRVGANKDQNWDVTAALTLPLFQGGAIQSGVRNAVSVLHQRELELARARRAAEQEIRGLHAANASDARQVEALTAAAEITERNYNEQSREYRLGLVTNLDVLQALNSYQDARRALGRARYTQKLNYAKLEAAVGARGIP